MPIPTPTLTTERLRLRPLDDADAGALVALMTSAEVLRLWDEPPWEGPEPVDGFLARSRRVAEDGTGARLAVEDRADGVFLGWCALNGWDPAFRSASLTVCLARTAWGRGVATESLAALLDWAYATLDLNRVQAECDTRNLACARVLEKLGFLREGTLREDCVVDGVVSDSWVYGVLRRDRPTPHA